MPSNFLIKPFHPFVSGSWTGSVINLGMIPKLKFLINSKNKPAKILIRSLCFLIRILIILVIFFLQIRITCSWIVPRRILNGYWLRPDQILIKSFSLFLSRFWIGLSIDPCKIRISLVSSIKESESKCKKNLKRILNQTWQNPLDLLSRKILQFFFKKWTGLRKITSCLQRS